MPERWWQKTGLWNALIGAFSIWFIKTRKGPDDKQQDILGEQHD